MSVEKKACRSAICHLACFISNWSAQVGMHRREMADTTKKTFTEVYIAVIDCYVNYILHLPENVISLV